MDNFEGVGQGVFDIGFVGVEKSCQGRNSVRLLLPL